MKKIALVTTIIILAATLTSCACPTTPKDYVASVNIVSHLEYASAVPVLNASVLPADTGPLGMTTVAGIDSDHDGIRDDVQRYIELTYATKPALKKYAFRYAANNLRLIEEGAGSLSKESVVGLLRNIDADSECLFTGYPDDFEPLIASLWAQILNTLERSVAMKKALALVRNEALVTSTPTPRLTVVCP